MELLIRKRVNEDGIWAKFLFQAYETQKTCFDENIIFSDMVHLMRTKMYCEK